MSLCKRHRLLSFSLFSMAMIGLCISLGVWQLERLQWKTKLLESLADSTPHRFKPLDTSQPVQEFSKVMVPGTPLTQFSIHVSPRMWHKQEGSHLLVPIATESGHVLFVLYGWVPKQYDPSTLTIATPIFGVVAYPKAHSWFVPKNDPIANEWHTINREDLETFISARLPRFKKRVLPFYLLASETLAPHKTVRPLEIKDNIRNPHLQYAMTWFMLVLVVLSLYLRYIWIHVKNV